MVDLVTGLRLAAGAMGALGGVLVFLEFFQVPSYVEYEPEFDEYNVDIAPADIREHTWIGRAGGILVAVAFALQFFATLVA
jgi:hypothetical protein